jgi:hypothetical protein
MIGKPQVHATMLEKFFRCGVQFQRSDGWLFDVWDKKEVLPPSIAMAIGSSVHRAVEVNLCSKMETSQLLTVEQVKDTARDCFGGIYEGGMLFTEEEAVNIQKTIGAGIDLSVALSALHHKDLAPKIQPIAVEERFVIEMPNWPIDLSGQKDIREKDVIRDTKTIKATPPEGAAQTFQSSFYCLSEKMIRGALPKRIDLDFLVKLKTPKLVTRSAFPNESWMTPLMRRIERFVKVIEAVKAGKEAFTPADPNHWCCTEKYCGYAHSCEFWGGKK